MSDSTITVFDPRGHARVVAQQAAPRPSGLDGLRPGVLENRKANARLLLESMVDNLRTTSDLGATTTGSKPVAGPASRATMATLVEECDFVVVGSSD
ncbi:MAG: hypothetical protein F4052_02400 [Dehalococcoidia bacterium]|nr:hypothetical protein [Chloroflexota bacterium]MXY36771.1 hypothetical protein [Dehalococcoidia bacterium]MYK25791.1 hypothetical protein [Dehalococcoidia bacterium]